MNEKNISEETKKIINEACEKGFILLKDIYSSNEDILKEWEGNKKSKDGFLDFSITTLINLILHFMLEASENDLTIFDKNIKIFKDQLDVIAKNIKEKTKNNLN